MRALQFTQYGPADVLHVAEVAEPHAGPGQIRIAVRASGVTPGETYLRSGKFGERLSLPHVPGMDAAGVVDEVGEGVTGVHQGDEVFGVVDLALLGEANAEFAVLAAWAPKPAALSWEQAGGAAANVETATRALDLLGVRDGTTLLIAGAAGGVGTVAIQLAIARGVEGGRHRGGRRRRTSSPHWARRLSSTAKAWRTGWARSTPSCTARARCPTSSRSRAHRIAW